MSKHVETALPWLFMAVLLAIWELACAAFSIPAFVLPSPSTIARSLYTYFGPIVENSWATLARTLVGFGMAVVLGVLLGLGIGSFRIIYRGLYPILVGFNSIPKVAVVPVLVIWFGIGTVPAVLTAFLVSFFPIAVNVATGLATIEPELLDVMRSLGAKKRKILMKIGLPRSMPYFFASLEGRDHAGLCRDHHLRDGRRQQRHRLSDDGGNVEFRHAPGVRRPGGDRRNGHRHVRIVRRNRAAHDILGEARRRADGLARLVD